MECTSVCMLNYKEGPACYRQVPGSIFTHPQLKLDLPADHIASSAGEPGHPCLQPPGGRLFSGWCGRAEPCLRDYRCELRVGRSTPHIPGRYRLPGSACHWLLLAGLYAVFLWTFDPFRSPRFPLSVWTSDRSGVGKRRKLGPDAHPPVARSQ